MSGEPRERLVAGRYRLMELIGQGGMGRVWRAVDEVLDRPVAAKEIRIDDHGEDSRVQRERSLREARATARIDHPNVVRVYDVVEVREDGRLWIVMEFVAARSLEQVLTQDGPVSPREAARYGLGLVAALREVHAVGVLHRDIKPGNVLIDTRGRVVLTDFGIAAVRDAAALTMAGMLVGSPDYMAPERIEGRTQGPPSDLWSLGATLCAAVGGRSPFSRPATLATLHAVLYEEPELPERAGPLREVLVGLLVKDPEARLGLDEVAERLAPLLAPPAGPREEDSARAPAAHPPTVVSARGAPAREERIRSLSTPRAAAPPPPTAPPEPVRSESAPPEPVRQQSGPRQPAPPEAAPPEPDAPGAASPEPAPPGAVRSDSASPGPVRSGPAPRPPAPPEPVRSESAPSEAVPPGPVRSGPASPGPVGQQPAPESVRPEPGSRPPAPPEAVPPEPVRSQPASPGPVGRQAAPRPPGPPGAVSPEPAPPEAVRPEPGPHSPAAPPGAVRPGPAGRPRSPRGPRTPHPPTVVDAPAGPAPSAPRRAAGEAEPAGPSAAGPAPGGPPSASGGDPPRRLARGRTRPSRRSALIAAAGVIAAAGIAAAVVAAIQGGPDGDRRDPVVAGTSRPPSAAATTTASQAPGTRDTRDTRDEDGFRWAPPADWNRTAESPSNVTYNSPDGTTEVSARRDPTAGGDLYDQWVSFERQQHDAPGYRRIKLERTTFRSHPAVVWEYAYSQNGAQRYGRQLGFRIGADTFQLSVWYAASAETAALAVHERVKESFRPL
ncbi:protein kinase domain-containing protein [Streptomyces sp. URMC 123]|uniref:serine/threonine-protein kinase n=1 Tax=Streptomyces sp. URMC 123 TaxID=3423403 RepID=UPI003F19E097